MRRGGPRGRGNRPMQQRSQQQNQNQQIRPLMSGNLQGLKDIDMELELLKRKREIIEQQNEMLTSSYKPRKDYEQPFNQSRENRYDDYTRLYDDHPRDTYSGGGGRGSSARKRQYVPVWENETPPKRFAAPTVKRDHGSRLGPSPRNPRSNFQRPAVPRSAAPKPFRTRAAPPQKRREFNPTKVAKPSSAAPPVKLSSYKSPAERKKLVTESLADSSVKLRATPSSKDEWVLRADVEPSRQLNGRLELALGAIIKELRNANPQSEELFAKSVSLRAMKKEVRDRIWKIMVGKEVTSPEDVKATYYETYPSEDNDIIMKGLEAQKGTDLAASQSDDPEQYFRQNIHRLMTAKLEEMLLKLKEVYTEKNRNIHARRKYFQKKIRTDTAPNTVDTQPPAEATDTPQCENAQPETDKTEPKPDDAQSHADGTVDVQQPDQLIEADSTLIKTNEAAPDPTEKASAVESPKASPDLEPISNKQYEAFDKLTTYTMTHMVRRFTPVFLKTMEVDDTYIRLKENILNETRKKLLGTSDVTQPSQKKHASQSTPQKSPKEKIFLAPLHYVKILGKPGLPKRKVMETFFEQFKPRTIKKHKTIHNLLFVGLTSKKDFDDILAADGTVIGRYTLSIKISERSDNKGKPNNANDSVASVENMSQVNESGSERIEANVAEQVTDLTATNNGEDLYNPFDDVDTDLTDDQYVKNENGDQTATAEDVTETDKEEAIVNEDVEFKDKQDGENEVAIIEDDHEIVEIKDVPQADGENKTGDGNEEKNDVFEAPVKPEVKDVKGTPIRASARLSTPGGIKTRRMSKQT